MKTKLLVIGAALLVAASSETVLANAISDTTTAGWNVDRYAPSSFSTTTVGSDSALQLTISSAQDAQNRPPGQQGSFYGTQGVSHSLNPGGSGAWTGSADIYVTSSMLNGTAGPSGSEFWLGTGPSGTGGFYIMSFLSGVDSRSTLAGPASGSMLGIWNDNTGTWTYLNTSGFTAGWNTLSISSDGVDNVNYGVNGIGEFSQAGMGGLSGDPTIGDPNIVYLQGVNMYGNGSFPSEGAHSTDWKDISIVRNSVPDGGSTAGLLVAGLIGVGIVGKKLPKKQSLAGAAPAH